MDALFLTVDMLSALIDAVPQATDHYEAACLELDMDGSDREVDIEMGAIKTQDVSSPLKLILSTGVYE